MNYFQGLNEELSTNDLRAKIATLETENRFLYENNALLGKIVADYDACGGMTRIIGLESENEKLKENITSFIAIHDRFKKNITNFIVENEKLKEEIKTINADKNIICENRNEVNDKLITIQLSNQNLSEIIKGLRAEISSLKTSSHYTKKNMLEKELLSLRKQFELCYEEKTHYGTALEALKNKHTLLTKKHKKVVEERDFANKQLECIIIQSTNTTTQQPLTPKKNILKIVDPSGNVLPVQTHNA
jgi:chromosome segregation ATPase